jgi:hypothetical protein
LDLHLLRITRSDFPIPCDLRDGKVERRRGFTGLDSTGVSVSSDGHVGGCDCANATSGECVEDLGSRRDDSGAGLDGCVYDVYDLSGTFDYREFAGGGDEAGDVYCGWSCWYEFSFVFSYLSLFLAI